MVVKFGEINADQIIENEYRISVLERVVEALLLANSSRLTNLDISKVRAEVIAELQEKYPNSGIDLKG